MATRCMAKVVWKVIGLNPGLLSGAVGGAAWCGARQAAALVMDRVGSHGFAAEVDTNGLWSFSNFPKKNISKDNVLNNIFEKN